MLTRTAEKWVSDGHSRINPILDFFVSLGKKYKAYKIRKNEEYIDFYIKNTSDFERLQKYDRNFVRYL